jgi:NAD/NADP transhydrogenase alpha subunit
MQQLNACALDVQSAIKLMIVLGLAGLAFISLACSLAVSDTKKFVQQRWRKRRERR